MKRMTAIAATLAFGLAACATTAQEEDGMPTRELPAECTASGVQDRIGQRATARLGQRLLAETGARTLRWVPPETAVTMDYRLDRLTVYYDYDMRIERISCG